MDFATAAAYSHEVELQHPELVVAGIRRLKQGPDAWGLDVRNQATGRLITLDQKDLWLQHMAEIMHGQLLEPPPDSDTDSV